MSQFRVALSLLMTLAATLSLRGAGQPNMQRSAPQKEGRAWVEQLRCQIPVTAGGWLTLRADRGSVEVRPGPADRVECVVRLAAYTDDAQQARACLNHYQLKALHTSEGATLSGRFVCGSGTAPLRARFFVQVPLRFSLDLRTQEGSLGVEKLEGQLRAQTTGGDVRIGDVSGPVSVATSIGAISLGNIGQNVEARTSGGGIQVGNVNGNATLESRGGQIIAGIINGGLHASTEGGDVVVQAASGPVVVETAGGQIYLGQCGNTVRAQTAAGNIELAGARGAVNVETAGGSINLLQLMSSAMAETSAGHILAEFDANRHSFGPSRLRAGLGDVDVFLPANLPLTINAAIDHPIGPGIISDFPLKIQKETGTFLIGPVQAQGALLGGGNELNIQTTVGHIQIRKLTPDALLKLKSLQEEFWKNWQESAGQHAPALDEFEELQRSMEQQNAAFRAQLQELNRQLQERIREQVQYMEP